MLEEPVGARQERRFIPSDEDPIMGKPSGLLVPTRLERPNDYHALTAAVILNDQHARAEAIKIESVEQVEFGPLDIDHGRVHDPVMRSEEIINRCDRHIDDLPGC